MNQNRMPLGLGPAIILTPFALFTLPVPLIGVPLITLALVLFCIAGLDAITIRRERREREQDRRWSEITLAAKSLGRD